ncbi:hypothetical protein FACS1894159_08090 [Bacteroidia bacterium]|nr:hypothetical protein FACS1894159_08090 [Bacteroidia bacterium]
MQEILVWIIIGLCLIAAALFVWRRMSIRRGDSACCDGVSEGACACGNIPAGGCEGCPLQENCREAERKGSNLPESGK